MTTPKMIFSLIVLAVIFAAGYKTGFRQGRNETVVQMQLIEASKHVFDEPCSVSTTGADSPAITGNGGSVTIESGGTNK